MRQLWLTGWMQQSIRMVCAAFLTEYLNLHWVHGCRYVCRGDRVSHCPLHQAEIILLSGAPEQRGVHVIGNPCALTCARCEYGHGG